MKLAVGATAVAVGIAFGGAASQASAPAPIVFAADRAPTVTGEIWRLLPNGHSIDLSRSPAQDTSPVVSSDGKRVAFISERNGKTGVYEVGIDGHGRAALARSIPSADPLSATFRLAWQPWGDEVAVDVDSFPPHVPSVSVLQLGHKPIRVRSADFGLQSWPPGGSQPWSPDGQVLLLYSQQTLRAISPQGLTLWKRAIDSPRGEWSSQGLVAVAAQGGVAVYDEVGHLRFAIHLPTAPGAIVWSRDGTRLAVESGLNNPTLDVSSDTGKRLLEKHVPGSGDLGDLGWAGDGKVVIGIADCSAWCTKTAVAVDVRTGKTAPASSRWLGPRSADGKLAMLIRPKAPGFDLGGAPLPRGADRTYRNVPGCYQDRTWQPAIASPQFAGDSIVYESWGNCDPPFSNLYAVRGTTIHRLTNDQAQETQPALSPDGMEIAYVWEPYTGLGCKACAAGLRIVSASGAPLRTLTNAPDGCPFDTQPSWSPDGTTIVFSRDDCDSSQELFTIPAPGGTPHDLGLAGTDPAWGPTLIAYRGDDGGIWTAKPDGSDPTRIASSGYAPAWSPTGVLAFSQGLRGLVVGSNAPVQLPFAGAAALSWTPDGTRLVVIGSKTRRWAFDLYTVKPDGTDPIRLTTNYFG